MAAIPLDADHLALVGRRDRRWAVVSRAPSPDAGAPHAATASGPGEIDAAIGRPPATGIAAARAPPTLLVKMTGACNIACTYCYDYHRERWRGKLDLGLVKASMAELLARGRGLSLVFHGGEPLLNLPQIVALVEHGRRLAQAEGGEVGFSIQTNGTLFDDEVVAFLRAHRFDVGVSLDGPREINDGHRVDHRGRGTFDRVMAAFERHPDFMTHEVGFLAVVQDDPGAIAATHAFFAGLGVATLKLMPVHSGGREAPVEAGEADALDAFLVARLAEIRRGGGRRPYLINILELVDRFLERREANVCMSTTCGAGREFFVIDAENNLRACDINYDGAFVLSAAGAAGQGIAAAAASANAAALFDRQDWVRNEAPCRSCEWLAFCGGSCPGKALARAGTVLALDPDECRTRKALFPLILRDLAQPDSPLVAYRAARAAHRARRWGDAAP